MITTIHHSNDPRERSELNETVDTVADNSFHDATNDEASKENDDLEQRDGADDIYDEE